MVPAVLVPGEEMSVVGGEALVEPDMAPVLAGHEIPEPLMGQFVRHQALAAAYVFRFQAEEGGGVQGAQAGVFHAPPVEVLDAYLVVLGPGVGNPDLLLEVFHALLGLAEGIGRLGELGGRRPERHGKVPMLLGDFPEVARD